MSQEINMPQKGVGKRGQATHNFSRLPFGNLSSRFRSLFGNLFLVFGYLCA